MRLPDSASVFTAEVWAIIKALEQIKNSTASKYIVLQTHFRVSKLYITWSWNIPWLGWWYESVSFKIFPNVFCWVPSHTGIKGNEKVDLAAKSALDLPRDKVGVPYTDFKYLIGQYIFSTWNRWLERCGHKQASFCQASPGRLAFLLQAVQEGWSCLVLCLHRSYTIDPFIYPKEGSSTSMCLFGFKLIMNVYYIEGLCYV